jgi:outer membrane protein
MKNNQSILIAKENIKYAEVSKTLNLDNYLPSINAFISYTKNINPSSSANSSSSITSSDNYVSYGIQMSWNLWDWGIRNNQDNSLTEKVVAQRYLEKNQKEQILNQVFQNYSTIQNNISSVTLAKDAVQTAEEAYKLVSYRFLNGQVAALDLVTSQQSLTTAKASLAQARFNLDLAWLTFQATLGVQPSLSKLD